MDYYKKYLKYKKKYISLKKGQSGGTMPGLLPDNKDKIDVNSGYLGFTSDVVELPLVETFANLMSNLFEILIGPNTSNYILIDSTTFFFIFKEASTLFKRDASELFNEFIKEFDTERQKRNKEVKFIFDSDAITTNSYGSGNKRKSSSVAVYRELTSLLEYDLDKPTDARTRIKTYIISVLTQTYPHMITLSQGEGDEDTFIIAKQLLSQPKTETTTNKKKATIITVDGDLVISLLMRAKYDKTIDYANINILIFRSSSGQLNKYFVIHANPLAQEDEREYAIKILITLLFTSTDAGFGHKLDVKSIGILCNKYKYWKNVRRDTDETNIMRKFVATLSIVCFAWGLEDVVRIFLSKLCKYSNELIDILKVEASNQFLFSVFPYQFDEIVFLIQLFDNQDRFMNSFVNALRYLKEYENRISTLRDICKENGLYIATILFHHVYNKDFLKKVISCLYSDPHVLHDFTDKVYSELGSTIAQDKDIFHRNFLRKWGSLPQPPAISLDNGIKTFYVSLEHINQLIAVIERSIHKKVNLNKLTSQIQTLKLKEIEHIGYYMFGLHNGMICDAGPSCANKHKPEHKMFRHLEQPTQQVMEQYFVKSC